MINIENMYYYLSFKHTINLIKTPNSRWKYMNRNKNNMEKLYGGLGYEYYAASQLWGLGYEAYKMEADFGFDIMAYNQKERSFNNCSICKPYVFQVKSRKILSFQVDPHGEEGTRKFSEQEFCFPKDDFKRLLKEKNSYIICYFINCEKQPESMEGFFWLNNHQINLLYNKAVPQISKKVIWFEEKQDYVILSARITTQADPTNVILDKINGIYNVIEELKSNIENKNLNRILNQKTTLINRIRDSNIVNMNTIMQIHLIGKDGKNIRRRSLSSVQKTLSDFDKPNENTPFSTSSRH